ncbi:MAG: PTS sugar transporter subunit IIC [Erysipelotrichaceae bacterium]|jgi:PTS system mannose-specific IIC component|uniref:PTS mannose/fructose/sorbose/N-acetylgalactosamine transporter subunit IIC n=1 Tax=Lactimicrobium massiliense TaxID=2161814 RepID=UPI000D558150|nr:PTS sugar transporter subunit IIC [Lactimicrobium massiliense]MCH4021212.1 PTS sugar transporter subunit IIC [Erysipelotrichaceae bacterium]MCI1325963.1 PTS sugar transporter subunit IIC [Solobacterium sp.]MCH4043789.1 PTS sugar transporter subunit IIC [Erysipelotrichaceae bacterium]MCH4121006.1 PTS sugar transporter subunit IIC [Erysipelotrichaceae bacterium]MCI1362691.1 PTS sugar transporter subunit IIC [Solobacterium sp.]
MHLVQSLIVTLISVLMILDSRMLGRLNFERPLITCSICGLLLGNIKVGLTVGAQMELATLGMMSIGASGIDMNMGSLVGCAICIMTGADIETAITIAVPMTLLATVLGTVSSIIRIQFAHMCDAAVDKGDFAKAKRVDIVYGPVLYVLFTIIPVFLSVYFGAGVVQSIAEIVPSWVTSGVSLGANIIAFYGFAMLLSTMVNRNTVVYFFAGFLLAAYSGMSLTGLALVGIVLAVILYTVKYVGSSNGPSVKKTADASIDDLENLDN